MNYVFICLRECASARSFRTLNVLVHRLLLSVNVNVVHVETHIMRMRLCVRAYMRKCFSQILSFFGEISPFMIFECTCLCVYECTTSCLFSRYQVIFNSNHTHFFQKELDFDEANVKEGQQKKYT